VLGPGLSAAFAVLGERQVGAAGVLACDGALGFPVTDEEDLRGHTSAQLALGTGGSQDSDHRCSLRGPKRKREDHSGGECRIPRGASDQIKRAVSENAGSLGFKAKTWE
jgi:hypothetical protein